MRFLAVDDDPNFLEVLKSFMKQDAQHELHTVTSAAEALKIVRDTPGSFDAFFLDILMPEMNGVALCAELRTMKPLRDVPMFMLTAVADRHLINDAFASGATDYITKPLDPEELRSRLSMAARIHEEIQIAAAAERLQEGERCYPRVIDFDAPVPLRGQKNAIEYLALENYLMTLDRRGLIAHAAFGIHFETASQIYVRSESSGFFEALDEVATAIAKGLEAQRFMFTYAGAGDFIVVTLRRGTINMAALEAEINATLAKSYIRYAVKDLPTPRVRVGNQVRNGLFGERRANVILQQAIRKAQVAGTPSLSEEKHLFLLREAMKQ
ncbi:PleD family two-component system response regulator [Shimia sp. FJ5]|uniref:response regulator n=1 Tax=Shimia sp. FJ5 TaxID=3079054 RepID=UPI00293DCC93|nr:response regulator [Shimia sp. FJ5]MDV4144583.1 response regulator [Shimia sp. FJ5]